MTRAGQRVSRHGESAFYRTVRKCGTGCVARKDNFALKRLRQFPATGQIGTKLLYPPISGLGGTGKEGQLHTPPGERRAKRRQANISRSGRGVAPGGGEGSLARRTAAGRALPREDAARTASGGNAELSGAEPPRKGRRRLQPTFIREAQRSE